MDFVQHYSRPRVSRVISPSKMLRLLCIVFLILDVSRFVMCNDCVGLPSDGNLTLALRSLVKARGGDDSNVEFVNITEGPFYTCLALGTRGGTYRKLSVITTFNTTRTSDRDDSNVEFVNITEGPFYTCLALGTRDGTYRKLSVITTFNTTRTSDYETRQFEMQCSNNEWSSVSGSLTIPGALPATIGLEKDCSYCIDSASDENHCQSEVQPVALNP